MMSFWRRIAMNWNPRRLAPSEIQIFLALLRRGYGKAFVEHRIGWKEAEIELAFRQTRSLDYF